MVSILQEVQSMQTGDNEERWLIYTDIYQRYQFRYPANCTVTRKDENVYLNAAKTGSGDPSTSACIDCRFVIYKPRPFHDLIDLEEYLIFEDRQLGLPYTASRFPIANLQPGYRGIREVGDHVDGMLFSIIYISYQARIIPIHAVIQDDLDLDIKLARSVRFL